MHCVTMISRLLVLASFTSALAVAQTDQGSGDTTQDFQLPGYDMPVVDGVGALDDASFTGNPLESIAGRWPADLVVAPIPGYSPQLGWNMKLAGGYFLGSADKDPGTKLSMVGGFVMGAENGSYAYGGGASFHLLEDKLRVKLGAAYADIRYRFYGIGNLNNESGIALDILQKGPLYFTSGSWRVWKNLYLGLGYLRGNVDSRVRFASDTGRFDPSLNLDIGAYMFPIEIDSRDHQQFPRSGWLVKARSAFYRESAGSDFDAQTFKFSANRYLPMREQDVLALRLVASIASDSAPFFLLSTVGGSTDLRGYPSGRYRDLAMYALQSEYRWWFNDRWIFTGFAGFGEVAESFSGIGENFLPAAGVGARFVLSKKHRVSLSADLAVGDDGAEFYFGVGEAF